jgi:hypothetical protein
MEVILGSVQILASDVPADAEYACVREERPESCACLCVESGARNGKPWRHLARLSL